MSVLVVAITKVVLIFMAVGCGMVAECKMGSDRTTALWAGIFLGLLAAFL